MQRFAHEAAAFLREIEGALNVKIRRVAIDAPSAPKRSGLGRRAAEAAMDRKNFSCFATPSADEFVEIRERVRRHLQSGVSVSTIPHANQLWMLIGFALFATFRQQYECIEVFPHAIVRCLYASGARKSTPRGSREQLEAVARYTGWPGTGESLANVGFGAEHDRLDAYLAAWVASLPPDRSVPRGDRDSDDVIWVPKIPACVR